MQGLLFLDDSANAPFVNVCYVKEPCEGRAVEWGFAS